ncbi:MAG: 3-hydroxyisobutyrate dehydrogenase [Solirubrobacterales bacterium]|jgi:3-hydroxyisobutyrate dehydrogenase|nr:3-hydroxyisobutyrate dehydrogenase [Solirubrobacterales bacterium]
MLPFPLNPNPDPPTIAVLGTGRMGAPLARNLLAAGFRVIVWNRTESRAAALVGGGATLASSPLIAATDADVVLTMLTDGAATADTVDGDDGAASALRPGSIWIQMGTVGVTWTQRLAELAASHEIEFVDAPVSGSTGPAQEGELVILASGPENTRPRVQPIFDAIGRHTYWLGRAGNGTRMKVVLNNWLAASTEALAETLSLNDALGLDPDEFIDLFADNAMASPYAVAKGRAMVAGDFAPGFPLQHAFKDTALALAAAKDVGLELPLTEAVEGRWRGAIARGHGDEDLAAIITEATRRHVADAARISGIS